MDTNNYDYEIEKQNHPENFEDGRETCNYDSESMDVYCDRCLRPLCLSCATEKGKRFYCKECI